VKGNKEERQQGEGRRGEPLQQVVRRRELVAAVAAVVSYYEVLVLV
jgi:hypothetical protein